MARILLGWELGAGLWHARLLRAVGRGLALRGHEVTYALADPVGTWPVFSSESESVLQAPVAPPGTRDSRDPFAANTFADILFEAGFHSRDTLEALVRVWDGLLGKVQPRLVIADHAPSLMVACQNRIPVVQVGLGFSQPPSSVSPWPSLGSPPASSALEETVFKVTHEVLVERCGSSVRTMGELYSTEASFVTTMAEFDPYSSYRHSGSYVGPVEPVPHLPANVNGEGFFAYLSAESPLALALVKALSRSEMKGTVYLRDAHPRLLKQLRQSKLHILHRPGDTDELLATCELLIHHGGVGTSERALATGRPQLLVPRNLEQAYNAAVLHQMGVGRTFDSEKGSVEEFLSALTKPEVQQRACSVAELVQVRRNDRALERILDRCESIVSGKG